jgi:hypothetical protein
MSFAGDWVDQAGSFYGGAVIHLGDECSAVNPGQEVWRTASYECVYGGQWAFVETRADGATHSHTMELQADGSLLVVKGSIRWTLQRVLHETQCLGTLQAEDATLHGAIVHANTASADHQGFTGSSFVDYINANDDYIEWAASCSGGSATLSFRYSLAGGNRPLQVLVNGVEAAASLSFPATGAWNQWGTASVDVDLSGGSNTIRLVATGSSGANTDSLTISS